MSCTNCGRAECQQTALDAKWQEASAAWQAEVDRGGSDIDVWRRAQTAGHALAPARADCNAHAVDWRARALAAEARVADLEALLRQAMRGEP